MNKLLFFYLFFVLIKESICNITTFDIGWKYGEIAYLKCKKVGEPPNMKGSCSILQEIIEDMFDVDVRKQFNNFQFIITFDFSIIN